MNTAPVKNVLHHEAESAAALFPALLIEAERLVQTVSAGLHGRRRAGPGETFWQHRQYSFGDAVSAIDWRQSARAADRLYVRENEWEAAAAVYIWRDASQSLSYASNKNLPEKLWRANVLCTALSILLTQAGERVGILGHDRRPFHGRGAPGRFLETLLNKNTAEHSSIPPKSELPTGARIVLVSDFFVDLEKLREAVNLYTAAGASGALLQICDPAEEEFPFSGRVEFADMEGPEKIIFGRAGSVTEKYKEKFAAHRQALKDYAKNAGWTLISHRTDKSAQSALLALFTALGDTRIWT